VSSTDLTVRQLELKRREIDAAAEAFENEETFIDHAPASSEEKSAASDRMTTAMLKVRQAEAELTDLVLFARLNAPEAVNEWVAQHLRICNPTPDEEVASGIRLDDSFLRTLREQWQEVAAGTREIVSARGPIAMGYRFRSMQVFGF
jgi:hypothetical protein